MAQFDDTTGLPTIYRTFRERFTDTGFVRTVASPDLIQHFLPPGTSRIAEE